MPNPELLLPGRFRGAVFDFDGLLVDSEPGWSRAEAKLLARHGAALTLADRHASVGRSIADTAGAYADRLGLPHEKRPSFVMELVELARDEYLAGFEVRPGGARLVAALRPRMRLALASNTTRSLIDLALSVTPFAESFDAIVTSDDVEWPKPAPDLYLLACARLDVGPGDAVAFEDSMSGVRSAHDAGLTVIAVPDRPGPEFAIADLVVQSLLDIRVESV